MFADRQKKLVVITTETRWDEPPRMRHHVAWQLSRQYNVLFVELYSRGSSNITKISDTLAVLNLGWYVRGIGKNHCTKLIFDKIQAFIIATMLKKIEHDDVYLLNFKFDFWPIYTYNLFKLRYFFLNDDFINMSPTDTFAEKEIKRKLQNKVASLSHRVFASSGPLAEDVRGINEQVSIIHSGHDFSPENNKKKSKSDKIRVCFMGFVHGNLELGWIERLAQEHNIQVIFVGPIESQSAHERLMKHKNIAFHPPLIGVELQKFISQFDVFIMPYTSDEINTKASVPAKLFQYLACGRPVVSSLMPHLLSLPDKFVYQSGSADDFVLQVFKAYREDTKDLCIQRVRYSSSHHWNERGDQLCKIIEEDTHTSL